jgi:hypothetical protein
MFFMAVSWDEVRSDRRETKIDSRARAGLRRNGHRACRAAFAPHAENSARRAGGTPRVGTLDEPGRLPPDMHVLTASKQPWVVLRQGVSVVEAYYDRRQHWPRESRESREALPAR